MPFASETLVEGEETGRLVLRGWTAAVARTGAALIGCK